MRPTPPHDLQTNSPCRYAASKAAGELVALEAPGQVVVIRPGHIYGPSDAVATHIAAFPPLQIGPPTAQMSMVSVETLVSVFLTAGQRASGLAGKCYFVKDCDYFTHDDSASLADLGQRAVQAQ